MNNPNNLFSMMQTGGLTRTAGGAALARAKQRQSDIKMLERNQRREARRQKRGSFWGSLGSLAGGLLGAAIPGLGTVIGAGLGSALGKRAGEGLGAGKTKKYDSSGTVYGQESFKDINRASRDYTRGMGERALLAGAQTALTAGLSPDGGIYGSKNPFREGSKFRGFLESRRPRVPVAATPDTTLMDSYFNKNLPNPSVDSFFSEGISPSDAGGSFKGIVPEGYSDAGILSDYSDNIGYTDFIGSSPSDVDLPIESRLLDTSLPSPNFMGKTIGKTKNFLGELKNLGLARMYGIGGKGFAEKIRNQALLDNASLLMGRDIDEFAFLDDIQEQPSMHASLLGLQNKVNQYNNPIGMQDGGYTASSVLADAGFDPEDKELRLFEQFDPTQIQQAKEGAEQSLMSMTGGMGLSSVGGGFGSKQRAATSAIGAGQDMIGDVTEQSQKAFESQTLGTAADLIAGGADLGVNVNAPLQPPDEPTSYTFPGTSRVGADGRTYIWTGVSWVTNEGNNNTGTGGTGTGGASDTFGGS